MGLAGSTIKFTREESFFWTMIAEYQEWTKERSLRFQFPELYLTAKPLPRRSRLTLVRCHRLASTRSLSEEQILSMLEEQFDLSDPKALLQEMNEFDVDSLLNEEQTCSAACSHSSAF